MGQGPIPVQSNLQRPSGFTQPAQANSEGNTVVSGLSATKSSLFILAPGKVVKIGAGAICVATVFAAGSGVGGIYDCTSTAAAVTANQIAQIPETVGPIQLNFPVLTGLTVIPGTGQEVSVSYQ